MKETLFRREKVAFSLREMFSLYGYQMYQMTQFEEYDLYLKNKEFLVSDRVITFNDPSGRLLALKPDVTLSIIKNHTPQKGVKEKVAYNENVYRFSPAAGRYKEILQSGVEALGDLDEYDLFEVVFLAAESLSKMGGDFRLVLSHAGLLAAFLKEAGGDESFAAECASFISEKNAHDLAILCDRAGVAEAIKEKLLLFVNVYGKRREVLARLAPLCREGAAKEAFEELSLLSGLLEKTPVSDKILFDFSVVNNMRYYNGVVFKGYLDGVCESVLSGGCYDYLMKKMQKNSRGLGFAVYLDLLEEEKAESGADVLLLYDDSLSPDQVRKAAQEERKKGKSVTCQRAVPQGWKYKETLDLRKEKQC